MSLSGHIIGGPADVDYDGAVLTADLAIGDTVLHVDDTADFDEDAAERDATVVLGVELDDNGNPDPATGTVLAYTTCDDDAGTVTLAAPSTTTGSAGDRVYISSPVSGLVGRITVWVALDDSDTTGDALPATMDSTLISGFDTADLMDQAVELEVDEDEQLIVTGLPGLASAPDDVRADQDFVVATGPGDVILLLKYLPSQWSEHVYRNGAYEEQPVWTRDGYVVTVKDPNQQIRAGDVFWCEYLYRDPTTRPEQTVTTDLPATVANFQHDGDGGVGSQVGGDSALASNDGDSSYITAGLPAVSSPSAGYHIGLKFPAFGVPGTLDSVSLALVSKGTDSRSSGGFSENHSTGAGPAILMVKRDASGAVTSTEAWSPVTTENVAYVETVTPLTVLGSEYVTAEMLAQGKVEYLSGGGIDLTDGVIGTSPTSPSSPFATTYTYAALRITYTIPAYDPATDASHDEGTGAVAPEIGLHQLALPTGAGVGDVVQVGADGSLTTGAGGSGGGGGASREVLMASGVSFPAEPLESSDGGDWLYGLGL